MFRTNRSLKKIMTAMAYWAATRSPIAWVAGWIFRKHVYDGYGWIELPKSIDHQTASSILFRVYERPERILIDQWISPNTDCIELGASIGVISRVICARLRSQHRLIQVEASPELSALSSTNVKKMPFSDKVISVNAAVNYGGSDLAEFGAHNHSLSGRVAPSDAAISVPTTNLKIIRDKYRIRNYSLVMDIEGMEYDVIENDREALQGCLVMIAELHQGSAKQRQFSEKAEALGLHEVFRSHNVFVFKRNSTLSAAQ